MTTSAQRHPSEPDWNDQAPGLDAIGLAADFGAYVRGRGIPPEGQQQALGSWLDELITELEADLD